MTGGVRPHRVLEVPTVGVEEEFLLVDRHSRLPAGRAPGVVKEASDVLGERVQTEFFTSQAEVCTRPAHGLAELRADLAHARAVLREAAAGADCRPVGTGMPVMVEEHPPSITDTARYRRISEHVGAVATSPEGLVCGCHVHIGVPCRARALALNNRMRPWLPVLQALAVNSPFSAGRDTGYASWRHAFYRRWPTVGPAPWLDEPAYRATVGGLLEAGVILDTAMLYWYSRPSEHVPTLEIRVADTSADVDTTLLLAALVRGLATTMLAELPEDDAADAGPPGADTTAMIDAAHWSAAQSGIHGNGPDPVTGRIVPMRLLVDRLVERARPGLEAAGDLGTVRLLLSGLCAAGTGAERQRAAFARRGRYGDVVDELAALTAEA
ncbi:carboxylate-amine ligase [Streptomyces sp. TLI_235]|nr:glutamate--cysteine ligase [Streptomyces sp. TLI_235]PBC76074.1 carboxylate-amine ligase [Streptomyces sp. TLI_235]